MLRSFGWTKNNDGAETQRFDFDSDRSVQPNNTYMLCGRISDTALYSFCYRRIASQLK